VNCSQSTVLDLSKITQLTKKHIALQNSVTSHCNKMLGRVQESGKRNMENIETEKRCNYRQKVGSCDRLLAMAAVKLEMFDRSYISVF
jgi:hypothetical protein